MSINENYGKDIIMLGFARITGGLLSFFAIFCLTYLFSESEIGEYNLLLATINIITSITTLWLSQSVLRYYEDLSDLGNIIVLCIICAIFCCTMYFGYCMILSFNVSISCFFYIFVLVFYNVFDALFRRCRKLIDYVLLELVHAVGRLFPMIVIAHTTHDYHSIFLSQALTIGIFFCLEIILNRRILLKLSYRLHNEKLKMYLSFGIPLVGLSVTNWFITTSDRYIIKYLGNNAEVGIYSTNYSLANSIYLMFALIIVNAMHPIIMKKWETERDRVSQLVSDTMDQYFQFMLPLIFYGVIKAHVLLGIFKGDSYSIHSSVFAWTALGVFVHGFSLLCHKYYECIQKTNYILYINLIAAAFNIIANFLLIPIWGFEIAAFTTFLSYMLYVIIVRIKTYREFPIYINYFNFLKEICILAVFWCIDHMLSTNTLLVFFIEGIAFICYVGVMYYLLKVCDVRNVLYSILK